MYRKSEESLTSSLFYALTIQLNFLFFDGCIYHLINTTGHEFGGRRYLVVAA